MAGAVACTACGAARDVGSRSGKCRGCWVKPARPDRFCGCGARISHQNRSGLCRPCVWTRALSDPAIVARRIAGTKESNKDPALRKKRAERSRAACRTDAERQRRRELGKRIYHLTVHSPLAKERAFAPEAVRKRVVARLETMAQKRERKASAAKMETMTAFERAMERVRNGAGISTIPVFRRPEPLFTLGGVTAL